MSINQWISQDTTGDDPKVSPDPTGESDDEQLERGKRALLSVLFNKAMSPGASVLPSPYPPYIQRLASALTNQRMQSGKGRNDMFGEAPRLQTAPLFLRGVASSINAGDDDAALRSAAMSPPDSWDPLEPLSTLAFPVADTNFDARRLTRPPPANTGYGDAAEQMPPTVVPLGKAASRGLFGFAASQGVGSGAQPDYVAQLMSLNPQLHQQYYRTYRADQRVLLPHLNTPVAADASIALAKQNERYQAASAVAQGREYPIDPADGMRSGPTVERWRAQHPEVAAQERADAVRTQLRRDTDQAGLPHLEKWDGITRLSPVEGYLNEVRGGIDPARADTMQFQVARMLPDALANEVGGIALGRFIGSARRLLPGSNDQFPVRLPNAEGGQVNQVPRSTFVADGLPNTQTPALQGETTGAIEERARELGTGPTGYKPGEAEGARHIESYLGRRISRSPDVAADFVDNELGPISLKGPIPVGKGDVNGLANSAIKDANTHTGSGTLFVDLNGLSETERHFVRGKVQAGTVNSRKNIIFLE